MAAENTVPLKDLVVTVRELAVEEVRTWAKEVEAGAPVDPLRHFVFDDCSLDDVARMCDCSAEELERYGATELIPLRDKAKAMNPYFFRVRGVLFGTSQTLKVEAERQILTPS